MERLVTATYGIYQIATLTGAKHSHFKIKNLKTNTWGVFTADVDLAFSTKKQLGRYLKYLTKNYSDKMPNASSCAIRRHKVLSSHKKTMAKKVCVYL